jgi:hypothetical protein
MVSVAYLVFTFLACVLGAGLGLIVFRAWQAKLAFAGMSAPNLASGNEEDKWNAIRKWQTRENRTFAACVSGCAASPLALAAVAWTLRGEVVGTICSGLTTVSMNSPLCF